VAAASLSVLLLSLAPLTFFSAPRRRLAADALLPPLEKTTQSLVAGDDFQHILRVLNTNVDGKNKVMYALTAIRGIGRRFANLACKKAEVDMRKR
jgi:hypothetical protein